MHQEHVQSTAATQPLLPEHEDLEPATHEDLEPAGTQPRGEPTTKVNPTTTALAPTPVTTLSLYIQYDTHQVPTHTNQSPDQPTRKHSDAIAQMVAHSCHSLDRSPLSPECRYPLKPSHPFQPLPLTQRPNHTSADQQDPTRETQSCENSSTPSNPC